MAEQPPGIRVLGQQFDWPNAWHATVAWCVTVFLVGVFGVVVVVLVLRTDPWHLEQISRVILEAKEYSAKGVLERSDQTKQIEFWTPSSETHSSLIAQGPIRPDQAWEDLKSDDRPIEFGRLLAAQMTIKGFRRFRVSGHGRTTYKDGWWWVLTTTKDFDTSSFVRLYEDFWHSNKTVYIEEVNNDAGFRR